MPEATYSQEKKRVKRKAKRFKLKYFFRWLSKEPLKFVAYISAIIMVYVTFLFIQFARDQHKNDQNLNVIQRSVIVNKP